MFKLIQPCRLNQGHLRMARKDLFQSPTFTTVMPNVEKKSEEKLNFVNFPK